MIKLHRLNGADIRVTVELIEMMEANPDTTLLLATGNRLVVKESVDEVMDKILDYRRTVYAEGKVLNPIEGFVRK